jgi:hypothetical protein
LSLRGQVVADHHSPDQVIVEINIGPRHVESLAPTWCMYLPPKWAP